ncbi:MAG: hypothetical protein ACPGYL_01225, partial [Rhodospirillaceae bacterium]
LTGSLAKDGQTTATADLPMGGYKHTSVANGTARTDYAAIGQIQDGSLIWCGTAGGTANALTLSPAPAITSHVAGQTFVFVAAFDNTGSTTVAVSGLAAEGILLDGSGLSPGDLVAGKLYTILFDGDEFQLNPLSVSQPINGPILYNGNMAVCQRATSRTTDGYLADRWHCSGGATSVTYSVVPDGPTGYQNSLQLWRTAGTSGSDALAITQVLETADSIFLQGEEVVLSVWAKAGINFSGTVFTAHLQSGMGTDEGVATTFTNQASLISETQTPTDNWVRYVFKGTVSSTTTQIRVIFSYTPNGVAGADDFIRYTGIQLDKGGRALPNQHEPYATNLARCQRFFQKMAGTETGWAVSATGARAGFTFPVMRVAPTFGTSSATVLYGPGGAGVVSSVSSYTVNGTSSFWADFTIPGGLTLNTPTIVILSVELSAEL